MQPRLGNPIALLVALATCGGAPATSRGQSAPAAPAPVKESKVPVIGVGITVVHVDAVVLDKHGHQVTDLNADDFLVSEDGRSQSVTHCTYIAGQQAGPASPEPRGKTKAPRSLPPMAATRAPETATRTIAIVVDDLSMDFPNLVQTRAAITKYILGQMQPGDLVAILPTSRGGSNVGFVFDKRPLLAVADSLRWNSRTGAGCAIGGG